MKRRDQSVRPPSSLGLWLLLFLVGLMNACSGELGAGPGERASEGPGDLARAELEEALALFETRDRADLVAAAERFERAVAHDPGLAAAWSGLADSHALLGLYSIRPAAESMPKARDAALRALELDRNLARAHASLGLARYLHDWDFAGAEESFRRALELEPEYASAHHWFAMMLTATGRHQEAVLEIDRALEDEPESRILTIKAITILTAARDFERAERQAALCLERFPKTALVHRELGFLRLAQGRVEDAIAPFERAEELSGSPSGGLGYAYALSGRADEAVRVLRDLEERAASSPVPPLDRALVLAGLGDGEGALSSLEEAFEARDPGLVYLFTKPGLGRLRQEAGMSELGRRIGLVPAS